MIGMLALIVATTLTRLLPSCGPVAASHVACDGDVFKPVWATIEDETGEITKFDTRPVTLTAGGGGIVAIYTTVPGAFFDPRRLQQIYLNCHGQYAPANALTDIQDAPPHSVIGMVAATMCPIITAKNRATSVNTKGRHKMPRCTGSIIIFDTTRPNAASRCGKR